MVDADAVDRDHPSGVLRVRYGVWTRTNAWLSGMSPGGLVSGGTGFWTAIAPAGVLLPDVPDVPVAVGAHAASATNDRRSATMVTAGVGRTGGLLVRESLRIQL